MGHIEKGRVALTNTKTYPFNDSATTVAFQNECIDRNYFVITDVLNSDGEIGDVEIFDRAVNGFKIAYTGSAKNAELGYLVIEGCVNDY